MIAVEERPRLGQLVRMELLWLTPQIGMAHVLWLHDIDHVPFIKRKIVTVTHFTVLQELQHFLLRQRREEQPELHLMIAISCAKQCIKLAIGHYRKGIAFSHIARLALEFFDSAIFSHLVEKTILQLG